MTTHKQQSTSALRRRRQAVKKLRAELKRELREIEAEMASRKPSDRRCLSESVTP